MTYYSRDIEFLGSCLSKGVEGRQLWNESRAEQPSMLEALHRPLTLTMANHVKVSLQPPNLWLANLAGQDLSGYDLSDAFLSGANLQDAVLHDVDLSGAHLMVTNLRRANICRANLTRANLLDANLGDAVLSDASLSSAMLLRTNVEGAVIRDANIHGVSVWGLKGQTKEQKDLTITTVGEPLITVDDIEVGQFVYLLLHNPKIRNVIDALTSKVVLLLGNFSSERKPVLDSLRDALRGRNFSPVLFDFDQSSNQDISDTVTLLARLARFVIADLTEPRCVQQELSLIAPQVLVPIQPIIQAGHRPWAMFGDLRRRSRGLMNILEYTSTDDLLRRMPSKIIVPAESCRAQLLI